MQQQKGQTHVNGFQGDKPMTRKFRLIRSTLIATLLSTGAAYAAAPFTPANQPLGYIGPVELSDNDLKEGANAYRGWFENGSWQGDLIEYTVTSTGSMSTSIDLTGLQPKQGGSENWSAHVVFASQDASYWNDERKIILGTGDGQTAFRWSNLSNAQQKLVDPAAEASNAPSSMILDFLRGDRSNEFPEGAGGLRQRFSILGDIIHSNPEYVAVPSGGYFETSYVNFVNTNAGRRPTVYVGANDGMLHAFDANDGSELWSYVPSMVVDNLIRLAGRPYAHTYFVDGGLTIQDAVISGAWKTVLVGSLGAGGKGVFVLDVTSPELTSESLTSGSDKKVMWEIDDSDTDIGYIFGESTIAKLNDGRWYAVNGNGVSSEDGMAVLLAIDLETGDVRKISTGSGDPGAPNGLAPPALVDTNNDGIADIAFAGDIDGDMWKFDLSATSHSGWNVAYKLYDGQESQPITIAPDVANHPKGGFQVLFGSGRLYTLQDITDTSTQSLFGIHDVGFDPGSANQIARVLSEDTDYISGDYAETVRTYATSVGIDWSLYNGWQIDLPPGERLITSPILRGGRLKSTITNPNGYSNWLLEATFDQGAYENESIYDLNRSSTLDDDDQVDNNSNGELGDPEDVPMAWKRETGTMSQVTVARLQQGYDTLFLNYLNPPLVQGVNQSEGCVGDCVGGVEGGHFDVSTDTTWAGSTQSHSHLYDDLFNITYVDWVNPAKTGLKNIPEAVASDDQEFIVLVANADLSPGVTVTVGNTDYNVVEYQRMLHEKLAAWNGSGPLTDGNGQSLILTMNDLTANGGTVRFTMGSRAIINGGLHATGNGCVNQDENVTNDRWRNGSLVVQLVERSHFTSGPALDRLHVQQPSDLLGQLILSNGNTVILKNDHNDNSLIESAAPHYEAAGGLVVKDSGEFIYEGAVHWHYGGNSCYGDAAWLFELAQELGRVPEELYKAMLLQYGYETFEKLVEDLELFEVCKNKKENQGGCKETYEALLMLYELGLLVNQQQPPNTEEGGTEGGEPSSGFEDLTGEPVVIEGGVSEGGLTSGPNFDIGRRTWTDLLPSN